jgi:hypothetical protein
MFSPILFHENQFRGTEFNIKKRIYGKISAQSTSSIAANSSLLMNEGIPSFKEVRHLPGCNEYPHFDFHPRAVVYFDGI